jgi:hypothetical protein
MSADSQPDELTDTGVLDVSKLRIFIYFFIYLQIYKHTHSSQSFAKLYLPLYIPCCRF